MRQQRLPALPGHAEAKQKSAKDFSKQAYVATKLGGEHISQAHAAAPCEVLSAPAIPMTVESFQACQGSQWCQNSALLFSVRRHVGHTREGCHFRRYQSPNAGHAAGVEGRRAGDAPHFALWLCDPCQRCQRALSKNYCTRSSYTAHKSKVGSAMKSSMEHHISASSRQYQSSESTTRSVERLFATLSGKNRGIWKAENSLDVSSRQFIPRRTPLRVSEPACEVAPDLQQEKMRIATKLKGLACVGCNGENMFKLWVSNLRPAASPRIAAAHAQAAVQLGGDVQSGYNPYDYGSIMHYSRMTLGLQVIFKSV